MNTQNLNNDNFKFFVPLEISKAKDSSGKEVMKIGGIASTDDKDSDDEVLEPNGFDLSYFMRNGFINWHHQSKTNPAAVIGEPTKAEITEKGLYIEGELYNDSPVAKQVWDLAKTLEKSSKTRRLGFSIEGKALERDSLDKKRITKAKITGVAITPSPKNACTMMDIIKGEVNGYEPEFQVEVEKAAPNGGECNVIDITKPNGDRIVVDRDYNVKVIQKALDTTTGEPLKEEDVEHDLKDLEKNKKKSKKNIRYQEKTGTFVSLNKANLFSEVCKFTNDITKAKLVTDKVFENLNKFDMSNKYTVQDEIIKALEVLGIENADEIVKAGMEASPKAEEDKDNEMPPALTKKEGEEEGENNGDEDEDEDDEDVGDMEKALADKQAEIDFIKSKIKAKKASNNTPVSETEDISKAFETFQEETKKEIEKANSQVSEQLGTLLESFNEFKKGIDERFEKLEGQPAVGRKSVTTQAFIEKSFGEENQNEFMKGKQAISASKNKQQVSNLLLAKSGIEKGEINEFYSDALTGFEATGSLSKAVMNDLFHNHNILITQ